MLLKFEQMAVAGNNRFGLRAQGTGQDRVVRIVEDHRINRRRPNNRGKRGIADYEVLDCYLGLVQTRGKLFAPQYILEFGQQHCGSKKLDLSLVSSVQNTAGRAVP